MKRIRGLPTLTFSAIASMACAMLSGCDSGDAPKPATAAIVRLPRASSGLMPWMRSHDGAAELERFRLHGPVAGGDPIDVTSEIRPSKPAVSEEVS